MEEMARWYVVHTYSGYENKVAKDLETMVENRRLQHLIQDVKVPVEMVPEIKDGKERMIEHKLFPGPASKPVPLSDEEVEKLGVEITGTVTVDYQVGDSVEIVDGPLQGLIGLVEEVDLEHQKVKIKVSMFGRETPAELELKQVKPL